MLRDDFRIAPKNVKVAVGESATIECSPPKGHPEPTVKWKKNNDYLTLSNNRIQITDAGSLVIANVHQSDAGRYTCVAENMAGKKESLSAGLSVHGKCLSNSILNSFFKNHLMILRMEYRFHLEQ